jgi:hypothetical protein
VKLQDDAEGGLARCVELCLGVFAVQGSAGGG